MTAIGQHVIKKGRSNRSISNSSRESMRWFKCIRMDHTDKRVCVSIVELIKSELKIAYDNTTLTNNIDIKTFI